MLICNLMSEVGATDRTTFLCSDRYVNHNALRTLLAALSSSKQTPKIVSPFLSLCMMKKTVYR